MFKSADFESDHSWLQKFGHEVYDLNAFINAFFGYDESLQTRFEHLMQAIVTRFAYSIKENTKHHSGFYSMQLLVNILKRTSNHLSMSRLKMVINPLLMNYNYFVDGIFFSTFETLNKREESIRVPDKVAFISLKENRLLLIELLCFMVSVSQGQRRSVVNQFSSRTIDIFNTWIREKFDNSFVMVVTES